LKALNGDDFNVFYPNRNVGSANTVEGLAYSSDGQSIYAAINHDTESRIVKWDIGSRKSIEFKSNIPNSYDLEISPNNRWLVNAGFGDVLDLFDLSDESKPATRIRTEGSVRDVEFLPDNSGFFAASDEKVFLYDFEDYNPVVKADSRIYSIANSSNGDLFAVGCKNGDLLIYDKAQDFQLISSFKKADNAIRALKFSNNGRMLAVGYESGLVNVYNVGLKGNAKLAMNFSGHTSFINDLAFSPDNKQLASGASDNTARIWNLENVNNLPIVIQDDNEVFRVSSLAFSPDGNSIMIGCDKSQIQIWPTDLAQIADQYCGKLNRNLTKEEWSRYIGDEENYRKTCQDLVTPGSEQ
jgi:WD40 repeat protein